MLNLEIQERIDRREEGRKPGWSIYAEVGNALDGVPTMDLIRYYLEVVMNGHDIGLRSVVEEQIAAWLINKERVY